MLAPENSGSARDTSVHAAAARGIGGSGGKLPYGEQIQRSFGGYDISNVQAHADASASAATAAMGADTYATGNHVVLGASGKDLHTVAHEAVHVVQQQHGVSLSGGIGQAGDPYERHADAVADRVVQGKSAEGLLGEMAGGSSGSGSVQLKGGQPEPQAIASAQGGSECVVSPGPRGDVAGDELGQIEASICSNVNSHVEVFNAQLDYLADRVSGLEIEISGLMDFMANRAALRQSSADAIRGLDRPSSGPSLTHLLSFLDIAVTVATGLTTGIVLFKTGVKAFQGVQKAVQIVKGVTDPSKGAYAAARLFPSGPSMDDMKAGISALQSEVRLVSEELLQTKLSAIAATSDSLTLAFRMSRNAVERAQEQFAIAPSRAAASILEKGLDEGRLRGLASRFSGIRARVAVASANTAQPEKLAKGSGTRLLADLLAERGASGQGGVRLVDTTMPLIHWNVEKNEELRRTIDVAKPCLAIADAGFALQLAGAIGGKTENVEGLGMVVALSIPQQSIVDPLVRSGDLTRSAFHRSDRYAILAGVTSREEVPAKVWDNQETRSQWIAMRAIRWNLDLSRHPSMGPSGRR